MRTQNVNNQGPEPYRDDVYQGSDGQLWRWTPSGQALVASSGPQAVHYALKHEWPSEVVERLERAGARIR